MLEVKNDNVVHDTLFKIAHEVKNPLAVALGYLQMLDSNNQQNVFKYLPIIHEEVKRSVSVLDDFLNCTKISVEKDMMDLYYLIEETSDSLKYHFLEKENRIDCLLPDS